MYVFENVYFSIAIWLAAVASSAIAGITLAV